MSEQNKPEVEQTPELSNDQLESIAGGCWIGGVYYPGKDTPTFPTRPGLPGPIDYPGPIVITPVETM